MWGRDLGMEPVVLGTWERHSTLGLGSWGIMWGEGELSKRCFHWDRGSQSTDTKF